MPGGPSAGSAGDRLGLRPVLEQVAGLARSAAGAEMVLEAGPAGSRDDAEALAAATTQAAGLRELGVLPPVGSLDGMMDVIRQLGSGAAALEPSNLRAAGLFLSGCGDFLTSLRSVSDAGRSAPAEALSAWSDALPELDGLADHLLDITTAEGELSPDASPELRRLARSAERLRRRISSRVESLSSSLAGSGVLRDSPPTIRDGRFVLPVLSARRREVSGIVHDRSDSGATVFVEPAELVEEGNELRELELEIRHERRRILREATGRLRTEAAALEAGARAAAALDAVFARASWHLSRRTVFPEEGPLSLLGLRHPLIPADEVVENDVALPDDWRLLVVSGPNAGGKSVLLKAVGLASACARAGLGACVREGSTIPFFRDVYVCIGDMQSIRDHLSTYSARLRDQLTMLEAGEGDGELLGLIDEPAAGTDPLTGASLAAALLTTLADRGFRLVVTTHLGQLKTLAGGSPGFYNGMMSFDEETLEPDYRFHAGLPGSSFTFEIAARMGFPEEVLERAASMSEGSFRLDRMLEEITATRREAEDELAGLRRERAEQRSRSLRLQGEVSRRSSELEAARSRLEREHGEELRRISSRADSLLARMSMAEREERRELRAEIRELTGGGEEHPGGETGEGDGGAATPEEISEGDWVNVRGWSGAGRVERMGRGEAEVLLGSLRLRRPLEELTRAPEPEGGAVTASWETSSASTGEVDLRGMSAEEALVELDSELDACLLAGSGTLLVIHGKGTGTLMRAVADMAGRDPRVVSHRQGAPAEGGTGVTVLELRPRSG